MGKIPNNYSGDINVKIIKINNIYDSSSFDKLDNSKTIKVQVCDYESKQTFLYVGNKSLEIYYIESDNVYESVNTDQVYLIRIVN